MTRALLLVVLVSLFACSCVAVLTGAWEKLGSRAVPSQPQKIWIALKQRNLHLLEEKFWSVSDPYSPHYGKYLSQQEIGDLVAPDEGVTDSVVSWLKDNGALSIELVKNRDVIIAFLPAAQIETIFNVELHVYGHRYSGKRIVRSSTSPVIPDRIKQHIDLVHGIFDFPYTTRRNTKSGSKKQFDSGKVPLQDPGVPIIQFAYDYGQNASRLDDVKHIILLATPVCLNGMMSKDSNCNGTISEYILSANYKDITEYENIIPSTEVDCIYEDNQTECFFRLQVGVYEFITNIMLNVKFTNGVMKSASYPFPVASIPPVTPQNLWELYGIPNGYFVQNPKYRQSVAEFEGQYYSPEDLNEFFSEMGIPGSDTPVTVIGPNNPYDAGVEASLDMQLMMAMSPGIPTIFWSNAITNSSDEDVLKWLYALGNIDNPPLVNSVSYGMAADSVDQFYGPGYLARSDIEFMKLATQGITLVIADGDEGAGDIGAGASDCKTLHPDWPSQSPYVTSVGGTYITPLSKSICYRPERLGGIDCTFGQPLGEVATSLDNGNYWTTGGGFANKQPMPLYQKDFVRAYIQKTTMPSTYFNASGRAYPDFSAVGHNLVTITDGLMGPIDGTSCSAPIFAGIISLLNEVRAANGKPPLGFINPLFYAIARRNPTAFNDVVVGQNRCSAFSTDPDVPSCCSSAYLAEIGWDAVTGLGSPNFNVLMKEVLMKF